MTSFDDTPHSGDFFVSTNKGMLDVPFITTELNNTYWGHWMTLATVIKAINNSICFGLYRREITETEEGAIAEQNRQIGFARVVTDYSTFAWLCDVIIDPRFRGKGLGKFMLNVVMGHPDLKGRSILLNTADAHELYRKFGFHEMKAMKRDGGQS